MKRKVDGLSGAVMRMVTPEEWEKRLLQIRGVKSVALDQDSKFSGRVAVTVRYKFWTYLWPGLNRKVSRKVHEFIYGGKPISMSALVNGREMTDGQ